MKRASSEKQLVLGVNVETGDSFAIPVIGAATKTFSIRHI